MIRVGVIGAGYVGPIHLDALSRLGGVEIVRVVDINSELAAAASQRFNIGKYGTDWRELVFDSSIDVVHNCTPNRFHYEISHAALGEGKHVLSEKPLAMTVPEAEILTDLADQKRAVVGMHFCYRYYPVVQEMAVRVLRGDTGPLRFVTGSYLQDWLSRETDWSWRLLRSESGESNIAADLGSHWFDLIEFISGLKVSEVMADLATLIPIRKRPLTEVLAFFSAAPAETMKADVELEDYAAVLFRLSKTVPGSFTTSQVSTGRRSDTEVQFYGSNCSLAWNHRDSTRLWIGHRDRPNELMTEDPRLQDSHSAKYATLPGGHPLGYYDAVLNLFKDFYAAVKGEPSGPIARPTFKTGLRAMRILKAVLESNHRRSWVEVAD